MIEVEGLPGDVEFTYTVDDKPFTGVKEPGVYDITATHASSFYQPLTLTATMEITVGKIRGVEFSGNKNPTYDGYGKTLSVSGYPAETTNVAVTYTDEYGVTSSSAVQGGTYTVAATITATHFETKTFTTTLTVQKKNLNLNDITFTDQKVIEDGEIHKMTLNYLFGSSLPQGVTPRFYKTYSNGVFSDEFMGASAVGTYSVYCMIDGGRNYNNRIYNDTFTQPRKQTLTIATDNVARLEAPTGVILDAANKKLSWNSVGNASTVSAYHVYVYNADNISLGHYEITRDTDYLAKLDTECDLIDALVEVRAPKGNYTFRVVTVPTSTTSFYESYKSESSAVFTLETDSILATPKNIRYTSGTLKWDPADSEVFGYDIKIMKVSADGNTVYAQKTISKFGSYMTNAVLKTEILDAAGYGAGDYIFEVRVFPSRLMGNGQPSSDSSRQSGWGRSDVIAIS
jgi:hypothetical protein